MRARTTPHPVGVNGNSPVPLFLEQHSEEEWRQYLDARRRGITPDLAAREIGLTGTAMRAFLAREPEKAQEAKDAAAEGEQHYQERLRATARVLALDTANPNARVLEVELATHVPGYEHLRRDRVKHEGHVTHGIVIDLSPEALEALSVEEIDTILPVLRKLNGEVIDGEATEIREIEAA